MRLETSYLEVLVSLDFPYGQWGDAAAPQGDPSYPKISTEVAVRDIFLSSGYCGT